MESKHNITHKRQYSRHNSTKDSITLMTLSGLELLSDSWSQNKKYLCKSAIHSLPLLTSQNHVEPINPTSRSHTSFIKTPQKRRNTYQSDLILEVLRGVGVLRRHAFDTDSPPDFFDGRHRRRGRYSLEFGLGLLHDLPKHFRHCENILGLDNNNNNLDNKAFKAWALVILTRKQSLWMFQ